MASKQKKKRSSEEPEWMYYGHADGHRGSGPQYKNKNGDIKYPNGTIIKKDGTEIDKNGKVVKKPTFEQTHKIVRPVQKKNLNITSRANGGKG